MADESVRHPWNSAVLALVVAAASGPGFGQEKPEDLSAVLGEIVVTAQKRPEKLQDVPVSVSTLSGDHLEAITAGGPDVRYLSARAPSLIVESSFGRSFPRFYMRGLGNTDFDPNASQPVSILVDEVVLENPILKGMPLWDLDRIEILRGPQGTLFGRNTPAGAVKFESKRPSRDLDATFRVSYGSYGTLDVNGGVGGPLSDTLSMRFSGLYQAERDWIDNGFTGEDDALGGHATKAFRLQFLWEPMEGLRGLLNLHGWDLDGTARVFRANMIEKGSDHVVPGFEQDEVFQDGKNEQEITSKGGMLRFEYDFGPTLTSVTGFETVDMYSRGDIDGGYGAVYAPPYGPGTIPFPSETADSIPDLDQLTQELRVSSKGGGRFDWLGGLFYFRESLRADSQSFDSLAPGNPQDGYAFQQQEADSYALFGSVDLEASDRLRLKAGLRFTNDRKDFSAERPRPRAFNTATLRPIDEGTDANFIDWDVNASYEIDRDFHLFGRIATGSRAPSIQGRILHCPDTEGGTNPATDCVSVADTEDVISAEAGIKTMLLDRRLRLYVTGYAYEVDGQQVTAVGGTYNTATLLNVDKTLGYGLEGEVEYKPSTHWKMGLGVSYNPTRIRDADLAVTPCGGGCTILDPIGPSGALVDGNNLPQAPEWIVNGIVHYRPHPTSNGPFGALDFAYHSEKRFFLYESEEFKDDGLEVGLRLGYAFGDGAYEVALYGRNITDAVVVQGGIDFNNLTGMTNEPRIVAVELTGRF